MTTLFANARSWLGSSLTAAAGVSISYTRGATTLSLAAIVGRTVFRSNNDQGAVIQFGDRDYLIEASALTLGAPALGDRIVETIDGVSSTFEVITPDTNEPAWRWSDPAQTRWRIHVKRVA